MWDAYRDMVEILETSTKTEGDIFGKVSSALLRLRGRLFKFRPDEKFNSKFWIEGYQYLGLMRFDENRPPGNNLHCMPLIEDDSRGVRGLILEPSGKKKGEFLRFGVFSLHDEKDYVRFMRKDLEADNDLEYEEYCGDGLYPISII
jgi:hypothetical protein